MLARIQSYSFWVRPSVSIGSSVGLPRRRSPPRLVWTAYTLARLNWVSATFLLGLCFILPPFWRPPYPCYSCLSRSTLSFIRLPWSDFQSTRITIVLAANLVKPFHQQKSVPQFSISLT